jgi:hypothetical protein
MSRVSPWSIVVDNAKMAALYTLGVLLVAGVWWPSGALYVAYCFLSLWLYIRLICPSCLRYHAASCLSGYHIFSRLYAPADTAGFARRFKRHVVWLYPVWFVPPAAAVYQLIIAFSWWTVALLAAFCLVSFLIVPYISRQHSCKTCENLGNCPVRLSRPGI